MKCPNCRKEDPRGREMCPDCGAPIKPIPVPPGGKIRFGGYDWDVLDRRDDRALILTERIIEKRAYHGREAEITWEACDSRKYLNRCGRAAPAPVVLGEWFYGLRAGEALSRRPAVSVASAHDPHSGDELGFAMCVNHNPSRHP